MPLKLILIRHAKSSWDDPTLGDHDRPLNARGRRAADAIGAWLRNSDIRPDEVLCSTAQRTRETWDRIAGVMGSDAQTRFEGDLYLASPEEMLHCLNTAEGRTVALIAHNPGIGLMANALAERPVQHARFEQYPTAATTIFTFGRQNWDEVDWGDGRIEGFVVPRDLDVANRPRPPAAILAARRRYAMRSAVSGRGSG